MTRPRLLHPQAVLRRLHADGRKIVVITKLNSGELDVTFASTSALERLHADGRKIVVITNESTDRFKTSEAIEKAILKKTGRMMGFAKAHRCLHALCSALYALAARSACALHVLCSRSTPSLHPAPGSGRADACAVRHGQGQLPQADHRRVGSPGGGGQRRCTAAAERELLREPSAPSVASAPSAPCVCTHCSRCTLCSLWLFAPCHPLPSAPSAPLPLCPLCAFYAT